jgi:prepilin-type N-terminal cleavage/methylation domain-containing protein/prepilin-type processing-associated H-X9-DG protein
MKSKHETGSETRCGPVLELEQYQPDGITAPRRKRARIRHHHLPSGFTLVELLVVVGIIALLIAILLPSLQMARRAAQRTACAAKLHSMMLAAQQHRVDHADFYPLAGIVPGVQPEDLDDAPDTRKYDYYSILDGSLGTLPSGVPLTRVLCAISTSLETEMAGSKNLNSGPTGLLSVPGNRQRISEFLDPHGLTANFLCPSQANSPVDINPQYVYMYATFSPGEKSMMVPQSYVFNEYVLGWDDNLGHLRGKGGLVHQPGLTMFAMDGLGGSITANHEGFGPFSNGLYTVYNNTTQLPVTLANAFTAPQPMGGGPAGDPDSFDPKRHHGKINIAFCDGHVETRNITAADLNNVYIAAP